MTNKKHTQNNNQSNDDLDYLSSVAFDNFGFDDNDLEDITKRIDSETNNTKTNLYSTIFISVLCGLLIGVTCVFVWYQKSKNHPSVYQNLLEEKTQLSLHNTVSKNDTIFPELKSNSEKTIEHFTSNHEIPEPILHTESTVENIPTINPIINLEEEKHEEEIHFQFIPNAPVLFISNLKVTNYQSYYFKNNQELNLMESSGLSAEYENKTSAKSTFIDQVNKTLAHKLIRSSMKAFYTNHFVNCIEDLTQLYNYNKDDANAQFYLGMCYFQLKKYALAKTYFTKNIDNQNNIFHQESEFYLALSLLNLNEEETAKQQLQTIVNNKGFYSLRAKEVLEK